MKWSKKSHNARWGRPQHHLTTLGLKICSVSLLLALFPSLEPAEREGNNLTPASSLQPSHS